MADTYQMTAAGPMKIVQHGDGTYATTTAGMQYGTIKHGMVQGSTVTAALPSVACDTVKFKAHGLNSGTVWLGGSTVIAAGTVTSTTVGYPLAAGQDTDWLPVSNLNAMSYITSGTADRLCYMAFGE